MTRARDQRPHQAEAHPSPDVLFEQLTGPLRQDPVLTALTRVFLLSRDKAAIEGARKRLNEHLAFLDRLLGVVALAAGVDPSPSLQMTMPGPPSLFGIESARLAASSTFEHGDGRVKRGLSSRELEIAKAIASGAGVVPTAQKFGISPNTVRNHLKTCFRKLGIHTQVELVLLMKREQLTANA